MSRLEELRGKGPATPAGPEPSSVTEVTPLGMEIYYQWAPKRLYRVNGVEVPSCTTPLELVGAFGAGAWWGQGIGIEGALTWVDVVGLESPEVLRGDVQKLREVVLEWMKKEGLTVHATRDKAAERGTNVHDALEAWASSRKTPRLADFPETESTYIEGLSDFLYDFRHSKSPAMSEVMVGSEAYGYAGRFDLILEIEEKVEYNARCYPKKNPTRKTLKPGRYLIDMKTSNKIQPKFFWQVAGYEWALGESYGMSVDGRGVLRVDGTTGQYELVMRGPEALAGDLNVYTSILTAWKNTQDWK